MKYEDLPKLNATLNGTTAILLLFAYICIRRRAVRGHIALMLSAVVCSAIFLTSYLIYHAHHGVTVFPPSAWRTPYLILLFTHTVLAVTVLPLIIVVLTFAARRLFSRHRRIARFALPIWFYVSITGVIIYWMLYHLAPTLKS